MAIRPATTTTRCITKMGFGATKTHLQTLIHIHIHMGKADHLPQARPRAVAVHLDSRKTLVQEQIPAQIPAHLAQAQILGLLTVAQVHRQDLRVQGE